MADNELLPRAMAVYHYLYNTGCVHSKAEFASKLGRNRTSISRALAGNDKYLNSSLFKHICKVFPEINLEWLIDGTGEMVKNKEENSTDRIIELYADLVKEHEALRQQTAAQLDEMKALVATLSEQIKQQAALIAALKQYPEQEKSYAFAAEGIQKD